MDYKGISDFFQGNSPVYMGLSGILAAITIVSLWLIFKKAGEHGWAAIIPFYDLWVLFRITWGRGACMFLMLIPGANIVFAIMTCIKLARVFGRGGGFAAGLIFLEPVFLMILAFGSAEYIGIDGEKAVDSFEQN